MIATENATALNFDHQRPVPHDMILKNSKSFTNLPEIVSSSTELFSNSTFRRLKCSVGASPDSDSDSMGESESESGLEFGLGLYPCGLGLGLGLHLCGLGLKRCVLGLWPYGLGLGLTVSPGESGEKCSRQI